MKNINKLLNIVFFLVTILFLCHNRIFAEEIKITSPIEGVIVHPGQEIRITVETVDKYNINSVLIVTPAGVKEFLAPPYNWSIVIPDMLGPLSIVAGGKNLKGEFFFDKLTLNNQSNEILGAISVLPDAIYFDWPEQKIQLSAQGTYSDGKIGYITSSELGTTYNSDNPLVAVVDKNGLVTVRGNGNCAITVSNSGKSIIIPVRALMPEFIPATIAIEPKNLYLKSDEKYIISHIELPQDYYAQDINIGTIFLNAAIPCEVSSAQISNYNNNGIADLTVKFVRQDLWYVLERGEQVSVAISGEVGDRYFRGTDIIKVLSEVPKVSFQQFSLKYWRINWSQGKHDKNKFHLSGRIDLPDDYILDSLQKKGIVTIAIKKKDSAPFSQTATLDFKQHDSIWHYKALKEQTSTEPLDIEKMLIFWQPEGSQDQGHGKHPRSGWFMIQGNINISDTDQVKFLPKATFTLNIPIQNITTAGSLESSEEVSFKEQRNFWFYNAAPHPHWKDWQENWWEKGKED